MSDVGLIGMMSLLYLFARTYGWTALAMYYFIPYVVSSLPLPVMCNTDSLSSAVVQPLVRSVCILDYCSPDPRFSNYVCAIGSVSSCTLSGHSKSSR